MPLPPRKPNPPRPRSPTRSPLPIRLRRAPSAPDPNFDRNFDRDFDRNQPSLADPVIPQGLNWVPVATDSGLEALLGTTSSPRQPFSLKRGPFARRR